MDNLGEWVCMDLLITSGEVKQALPPPPTINGFDVITNRGVPLENELLRNNDLYKKLGLFLRRELPMHHKKVAWFADAEESSLFGAFLEVRFRIVPIDLARTVYPYGANHSSKAPYSLYLFFEVVETRLEDYLFQFEVEGETVVYKVVPGSVQETVSNMYP